MKKDVLMITHFIRGSIEGRFEYLASKLVDEGCSVELITSDYSHSLKEKRQVNELKNFSFNLTMLNEPSYKKNVSFQRFYSHFIFARNMKKYLKHRKKPDVIYCSIPSLDVAKIAADYARKNKVRFIIDIQDLWPEAFKMVFKVPVISSIVLYPMKRKADNIYSSADEIIAVSKTYAQRAWSVNNKCKTFHSVYLGTELSAFDKIARVNSLNNKPGDEFRIVYIGTLGHSYDITTVIDALKIIENKGIKNLKFIVMGDGPLKNKFENYAIDKEINVEFTGGLPYNEMVGKLGSCDLAINPISRGAAQSIINKHGDYAAAGLPVISTQESSEYRELVDNYHMGLNCINSDAEDVAKKILQLHKDQNLRLIMAQNSRRLAEEKFDRNMTYKKIVELIID